MKIKERELWFNNRGEEDPSPEMSVKFYYIGSDFGSDHFNYSYIIELNKN